MLKDTSKNVYIYTYIVKYRIARNMQKYMRHSKFKRSTRYDIWWAKRILDSLLFFLCS